MASLVTNSLAMMAARLAVPAFSFGINVAVARLLGEDVLGQYVELVAMLLVAQALAGGGLTALVTRDVAAQPERKDEILRESNRVALGTGLLSCALFLLYTELLLPASSHAASAWLALSVVPSAWIAVQEGWLMALHLHPRITWVSGVEGLVKVAAALAVFAFGGGLVGLCAGLSLARIVALVLGQVYLRRAGAVAPYRRPTGPLAPFARALLPFAAIFTLGSLYFRQDVLVVGALRSERETGFYGVASAFYAIALLVPSSVMAAVYPRLSAAYAVSKQTFVETCDYTTRLLTTASVPLALGLIAVAQPIVHGIYGERYLEAVPTLCLLAALLPLHGINTAIGQGMQAAHLQGQLLAMTCLAVVVNLGANLFLVERFGIVGAPGALLLSSGISLFVMAGIYHRHVAPVRPSPRHLLALFVVTAPIAATLWAPPWYRIPVALAGTLFVALLARPAGLLGPRELARAGEVLGRTRVEGSGA